MTSILQGETILSIVWKPTGSENRYQCICCSRYMYLGSEMCPHHLLQFHSSFSTNSKHSCKIILIMSCLNWSCNSQCIFWLLIKNVSYMIHWMQPNSIQSLSRWQSEKKWDLIKICLLGMHELESLFLESKYLCCWDSSDLKIWVKAKLYWELSHLIAQKFCLFYNLNCINYLFKPWLNYVNR